MDLLDIHTFIQHARKGNLIPLVKELILDCETPVSVFLKTAARRPSAFLLESVELGEKIGRYSFIGFDPETIIEKTATGSITITTRGARKRTVPDTDPLAVVQHHMRAYRMVTIPGLPVLAGGCVGYLSYENVAVFDEVTLAPRPITGLPQAVFFVTKELIVFDHAQKKVMLIVLADTTKHSPRTAYHRGCRTLKILEREVRRVHTVPALMRTTRRHPCRPVSTMSRQAFMRGVTAIKKYITAGDAIQVVFSQRFSLGRVHDDFTLYRALRTINPSPYMFYFKYKGMRLIGSSPEVMVRKNGSDAEVRPIAGTRRRGKNTSDDERLLAELKADTKEQAEHLMLVDLGRNDLGRVCEYGTVSVTDYARVERYSHVMHLVSEVHGTMKKGKTAFDLVRATFPAGTLSGAPKIRAMQIINELEPTERGPYGGCLGYFSFSGDCDMCITIRTIMIMNGTAYVQAGAGIVYDSQPAREYQETVNKAQALVKAIDVAARGLV